MRGNQDSGRGCIPASLNLALVAAFTCLWLAWWSGISAWLTLPVLLLTNTYWALVHEAIHGGLLPDPRWNSRLGRLLAIGHGAPFAILRLGHLFHHRYSRTLEASEMFDPRACSAGRAALGHYFTICGGLYYGEVLAGAMTWLPKTWRSRLGRRLAGDNQMTARLLAYFETHPDQLAAARVDALLVLVAHGLAFWAWGEAWPALLAGVVGRGAIVSFFDNAYHYGTPPDSDALQVRNHRLPGWAGWLILNFHWHGVHHRLPSLPWTALPAKAAALGASSDAGYFSGAWRQWRGPIPTR